MRYDLLWWIATVVLWSVITLFERTSLRQSIRADKALLGLCPSLAVIILWFCFAYQARLSLVSNFILYVSALSFSLYPFYRLKPFFRYPREYLVVATRDVYATLPNRAPYGIGQVIDGVKVRDGYYVLLTNQPDPSVNGLWIARKNSLWQRSDRYASGIFCGNWALVTVGTQWSNTLWICSSRSDGSSSWVSVPQNNVPQDRIHTFSSYEIIPHTPAEAAAYLIRLRVAPILVRGSSRDQCINLLLMEHAITVDQALFLSHAESISSTVQTVFGTAEVEWSDEVRAAMNGILESRRWLAHGYDHKPEGDKSKEEPPQVVDQEPSDVPTRFERDPVI